MLKAVSNSGPLIHLNELGQIKLLNVFNKLLIPTSVAEETGSIDLRNITAIKVVSRDTKDFIDGIKSFKLQKAEIEALFLAKKFNYIFLTDDLKARNAANKLNIEVHGTIGIITLAYKKGFISLERAKLLIIELYNNSTLFLTKSIVELAVKELENKGQK